MNLGKVITMISIILVSLLVSQSLRASEYFESVLIQGHLKVSREENGTRKVLEFQTPANEPPILKQGDLILSLSPSRILLKTDTVIELRERTRLKLDRVAIEQGLKNSSLELIEGMIKSSVSALKKGESFTIKNKDAAMSVRGTTVIVESNPVQESKPNFVVTCVDGKVEVSHNEAQEKKKVTLVSNQQAIADKIIEVKQIPPAEVAKLNQTMNVALNFTSGQNADASTRGPASERDKKPENQQAPDLNWKDFTNNLLQPPLPGARGGKAIIRVRIRSN